jgi:hypothetical protein
MDQQNIRDYDNQTYSIQEGAALVKELNDRTKHDVNGFNSIAEIATKLKTHLENNIYPEEEFDNAIPFNVSSLDDIANWINTPGFGIEMGKLIIFKLNVRRTVNGISTIFTERYLFERNKILGNWGTNQDNGEIVTQDLIPFGTPQILIASEGNNPVYIDLGDIETNTIYAFINALDVSVPEITWENLTSGNTYYFKCVANDVSQTYEYKGDLPVSVGAGSGTTLIEADFDLIATDINTNENNNQTINAGSEETNASIQLQTSLYRSYGQDAARTGNIVIDDENCEIGYVARVIHNDSVAPSILTNYNIVKTGVYLVDQRNDIWISKTAEDEITINYAQPQFIPTSELPTSFTLTSMSQTSNNFTSTTSSTWAAHAFSDDLGVGDCYIQMKYLTTANLPIAIGLSEAVESTIYDVDYILQIGGDSNIYRKTAGNTQVSTGVSVVANDILRIERSGTDILIKRSQDDGDTFTTLHTFTGVTSNDLYLSIFANGLNKVASDIEVSL